MRSKVNLLQETTDPKADEQQTAMVMIEDTFPRRPAQAIFEEEATTPAPTDSENKAKTDSEIVDPKADEDETALVMIEDTLPRRPPLADSENEQMTTSTAEQPIEDRQNSSDPLAAFFRLRMFLKSFSPRGQEAKSEFPTSSFSDFSPKKQ